MKLIGKILLALLFGAAAAFAQKSAPADAKPFVLGVVEELPSAILGEKRTLNIYLPEGYAAGANERYPVIYLLDGAADEDFIHVVGLVQFNNFEWIKRVPKSIVVGIANVDRRRDFTYPTTIPEDREKYPTAGRSEKFIAFLENELQPFIARKYRTSAAKMLIGQSLGGLLAAEILCRRPALFDKYVIVSPSLWWDDGSLLSRAHDVLPKAALPPTKVYIGVGKEGLAPGKKPRVMEVDANLLAERVKAAGNKNVRVHFDYLPQETHATVTHQAVFNAFRLLYPAAPEN